MSRCGIAQPNCISEIFLGADRRSQLGALRSIWKARETLFNSKELQKSD